MKFLLLTKNAVPVPELKKRSVAKNEKITALKEYSSNLNKSLRSGKRSQGSFRLELDSARVATSTRSVYFGKSSKGFVLATRR